MINNIFRVIKVDKLRFIFVLLLTAIISTGSVYVVYERTSVIDNLLGNNKEIWSLIIKIIVVLVLIEILRVVLKLLIAKLTRKWKLYLGDRNSTNIEKMRYSKFYDKDVGDHMTIYTYQLEVLSTYLFAPLTSILSSVVIVLSSLIFLGLLSWKFVVFALLSTCCTMLLGGRFGKKISEGYRNLSISSGIFSEVLKEYLTGYRDLKNLGQIKLFSKKVHEAQDNKEIEQYKISKYMAFGELTLQSLEKVIEILIFAYAVYLIFRGEIGIGAIASVTTILRLYLNSSSQIADLYIKILGTKDILNDILSVEVESEETFPNLDREIILNNISYKYGKKEIFDNLNFIIKKGEKYAIIGDSGSGKSTLVNILLGRIKSDRGNILVDGKELNVDRGINFSKQVGYISQQNQIFAGTVRYNITLGENYENEEIWAVLKKVCLDETVKKLDKDLDSDVGALGSKLSGGEKQRIVLARILIRNFPILVLDEATSALDEKTTNIIEKNILSDPNLTVLMISHNISEEIKPYFSGMININKKSY